MIEVIKYPSKGFYKIAKANVDKSIDFVIQIQDRKAEERILSGGGFLFEDHDKGDSFWWTPIVMSFTLNKFMGIHFYALGKSYKALPKKEEHLLIRYSKKI